MLLAAWAQNTHPHTQSCPHYTYDPYYMMYKYLRFCFWNIQLIYKSLQSTLMNSKIHSISTRNYSSFHQTLSHMTIYQKGPFYMGINIYNSLPPETKVLSLNIKKFKSSLRRILHQHSFHTLDEHFNYTAVVWHILTTKYIFIIPYLVWNFEVCFHM